MTAWKPVSNSTGSPVPGAPKPVERVELRQREKEQMAVEIQILELKVQKLQRQLWDKKSERLTPDGHDQKSPCSSVAIMRPTSPRAIAQGPAREIISGVQMRQHEL